MTTPCKRELDITLNKSAGKEQLAETTAQGHFNADEAETFANKVYQTKVRPVWDKEPIGFFLSVDLNSEDFELDASHANAARRLLARVPDADVFTIRVGYPAAYQHFSAFGDLGD